ncbi:hypothetical protein U1Q18_024682, partial [Sarracenia purpurea var. burkii]
MADPHEHRHRNRRRTVSPPPSPSAVFEARSTSSQPRSNEIAPPSPPLRVRFLSSRPDLSSISGSPSASPPISANRPAARLCGVDFARFRLDWILLSDPVYCSVDSSSSVSLEVATTGPPVIAYCPSLRRQSSFRSCVLSVISASRTKHRLCLDLGLDGDSPSRSRLVAMPRLSVS